jgi:site-specific recombinase XerD
MARHKIDRTFLRAIVATGKWQEFADAELRGFVLKVTPTGAISYTYRWTAPDGTRSRKVIGHYPHLQPGEARELARKDATLFDHKGDSAAQQLARHERRVEVQTVLGVPTVRTILADTYEPQLRTRQTMDRATINANMIRTSFPDLLDLRLDAVTNWHFDKWMSDCRKTGLKTSTTNRKMNAMRGLFSFAVERELIAVHPMKTVKKGKEPSGIVRFLSDDEDARLHAALDAREIKLREQYGPSFVDPLRVGILVSLHTGLRKGELVKLEWSHVNLEHGFLTVVAEHAKSGKQRHIPLNTEALAALKAWKPQAHARHVFLSRNGTTLTQFAGWDTLRAAAKIEQFRWHDLRHTFASRLVQRGAPLNTVRELMGHSDIRMTLRYAHLSPGHLSAAVALLEAPAIRPDAENDTQARDAA